MPDFVSGQSERGIGSGPHTGAGPRLHSNRAGCVCKSRHPATKVSQRGRNCSGHHKASLAVRLVFVIKPLWVVSDDQSRAGGPGEQSVQWLCVAYSIPGVFGGMRALSVTTVLGRGTGSWWAGMPRTLLCPMGLLWEEWLLHPTQIANIPPDIPVGEKSVQNDLGLELKSVLHINIQHFFFHNSNIH